MSSNLTLRKYSRIFTRPELPYFLIIWSTVFLCALGLTMVLSASTVKSLQESGNTYSIFIRQFFFLILGAMATYWAYRVQGGIWQRIAKISLSISIIILLLPFIPNLGKNINGNRNWIEILGFTLQPSEFAKFGLILWCALQLRNIDVSTKGKNPFIAILPGLVIIEGLILMERDLGTALLILLIFAGILFTTGAPIKHFIIVAALGVIVGGAFIISSSYRVSRFGALFNPFDDLKSRIVAPVPTNVPSEETPIELTKFVAIPERFDPSPTNEVAVTTPTDIPRLEVLPSPRVSSRVCEPPPPPMAPTHLSVAASYFKNLPLTFAEFLSTSSRNSRRVSPPPPIVESCC